MGDQDKEKLLNALDVLKSIRDNVDKSASERVGHWVDRNVHGLAEAHQLALARLQVYDNFTKGCGMFLQEFLSGKADEDALKARAAQLAAEQAKHGL